MSQFNLRITQIRDRVELALDRQLPAEDREPARLHRAMRYSVLGGGKRIRAALVFGAGSALGADDELLDTPACAVEIVHAYSLVHDDLPCMDDDDLRRGRPTCHVAFDEATALLVGDALQSLAFSLIASDPSLTPVDDQRSAMVAELAAAIGSAGMAGGQAVDLEMVGRNMTVEDLESMHLGKTGALIQASLALGALASGRADGETLAGLSRFGALLGLSFQIVDDILDVTADPAKLGKSKGKDQADNKPTYVSVLGLEPARRRAAELSEDALASLEAMGDNADFLRNLARYLVDRDH